MNKGTLHFAKGIGFLDFKKDLTISVVPDVFSETRSENDEFVLLASRGLWSVRSPQQVCTEVQKYSSWFVSAMKPSKQKLKEGLRATIEGVLAD